MTPLSTIENLVQVLVDLLGNLSARAFRLPDNPHRIATGILKASVLSRSFSTTIAARDISLGAT
jgi:hypothetical protein